MPHMMLLTPLTLLLLLLRPLAEGVLVGVEAVLVVAAGEGDLLGLLEHCSN